MKKKQLQTYDNVSFVRKRLIVKIEFLIYTPNVYIFTITDDFHYDMKIKINNLLYVMTLFMTYFDIKH